MEKQTSQRLMLARAAALGALLVGLPLTACEDTLSSECSADAECPSDERCNLALDVPVCQALGTGAEWTPCSSDDLCESDRCLVRASSVCVEPGWQRLGEACEHDGDCMSGLVCHTDARCETVAVARRVPGSSD
jgi:hypothetical protein